MRMDMVELAWLCSAIRVPAFNGPIALPKLLTGDTRMKIFRKWFSALVLADFSLTGYAQILIGQTAGFTGTVAAGVTETTEGAKLYIDSINAKGGVNSEKSN